MDQHMVYLSECSVCTWSDFWILLLEYSINTNCVKLLIVFFIFKYPSDFCVPVVWITEWGMLNPLLIGESVYFFFLISVSFCSMYFNALLGDMYMFRIVMSWWLTCSVIMKCFFLSLLPSLPVISMATLAFVIKCTWYVFLHPWKKHLFLIKNSFTFTESSLYPRPSFLTSYTSICYN